MVFLFCEWTSQLIAGVGPVSDTGSLKEGVGFGFRPLSLVPLPLVLELLKAEGLSGQGSV